MYGKFAHHEAILSLKTRVESRGNYLLPSYESMLSPFHSEDIFFRKLSELRDFSVVDGGESPPGGLLNQTLQ